MTVPSWATRLRALGALLLLGALGRGAAACGGCYVVGDSQDARVEPAVACLQVANGHSSNGCSGPSPTGIVVTNRCASTLTVAGVTVAPGASSPNLNGAANRGGRRSLAGSLDGMVLAFSWSDAADR
ncbi:MAG: hypothetical protein HY909_16915 [Deltaproteobacteria bacterium]|nr:hypothetical protein [Deltaproteobacteria bacterium]